MKRFFIASAVLAVTLVALSMNVVPVRCMDCGRILVRTNVCSALCGGCGDCTDLCLGGTAPEGPTSTGIADGTPATEIQGEATTERPS